MINGPALCLTTKGITGRDLHEITLMSTTMIEAQASGYVSQTITQILPLFVVVIVFEAACHDNLERWRVTVLNCCTTKFVT